MTTFPFTVNFETSPVAGQLQFKAVASETLVLAASTSNLSIPLPTGLTTANFVAVTALACSDLVIKLSTASGSTALTVPFKQTLLIYGATAVYASTTIGGTVQMVVG